MNGLPCCIISYILSIFFKIEGYLLVKNECLIFVIKVHFYSLVELGTGHNCRRFPYKPPHKMYFVYRSTLIGRVPPRAVPKKGVPQGPYALKILHVWARSDLKSKHEIWVCAQKNKFRILKNVSALTTKA